MPYKTGIFQAALGAISAAAFIFGSMSFGANSGEKRVVGTIERTGERTFALTETGGKRHSFQLADPVQIFFNEKQVAFGEIQNGRTASVKFQKAKRVCLAKEIDVFPTHSDTPNPADSTSPS